MTWNVWDLFLRRNNLNKPRLLQKSLFVIPEGFIGNPVLFKIKDFWIPVFRGMTAQVVLQGLLQEPLKLKGIGWQRT